MPPSPPQNPPAPEAPGFGREALDLDSLESRVARAAGSPLVRGGLTIVAGIVTGNVLGFCRVALTAYLLGTHSAADSLAVAIGPIDTLNAALISTIVFAFVPMLTEGNEAARMALFLKVNRLFTRFFLGVTAAVLIFASQLISILAPGLPADYVPQATALLRILSLSTCGVGIAAIHSALLYTERRFAPSAFQQATLNIFTILGAVALWKAMGIYGFAIGYVAGAWMQLVMVYSAARSGLRYENAPACEIHWREIVSKPASILLDCGLVALYMSLARAYATNVGPGTAAALDYCMRCIGVPLAFLVSPMSNSLLPEIARLRSLLRLRQAFRLIDRTLILAGLAAVAACTIGVAVRHPVIALLFQRGSFTADSTRLVAAVFLGFAPGLIGWSLFELTARSLFALDRPSLPLTTAAVPVLCNLAFLLAVHRSEPQFIGLGASLGFFCGFALLFVLARSKRSQWLAES
jgi:putative peptidoglycan lipid II flippase